MLDDVAWHALTGPHADLALTSARRPRAALRDEIAPFCGVQRLDDDGWAALAELVGRDGVAVFLRGEVEAAPAGWTELLREPATQYVAGDLTRPAPEVSREVVELTASDSPDMVALAAETEPGPFGPNSHLHRALVRHPSRRPARRDGGGADAGRGLRRGLRRLRRPLGAR